MNKHRALVRSVSTIAVLLLGAACARDDQAERVARQRAYVAESADFVARCQAYRQEMVRAVATGASLPKPIVSDRDFMPRWEADAATRQLRTNAWVRGQRFAFPHDSVRRLGEGSFELYYRLPHFTPRADLYCDPDRNSKLSSNPGKDAIDVQVAPMPVMERKNQAAELRYFTDARFGPPDPLPEWGLERRGRPDSTIYVTVGGRLLDEVGLRRVILCHQVAPPDGPDGGRLDCSMRFTYRDAFVVRVLFDESRVGEWQSILNSTTGVLDEAFRGKEQGAVR